MMAAQQIMDYLLSRAANKANVYRAIVQEIDNGADLQDLYNRLLDLWSFSEESYPKFIPDAWEQGETHFTDAKGWK